jgi:hypothetical protein
VEEYIAATFTVKSRPSKKPADDCCFLPAALLHFGFLLGLLTTLKMFL